MAGASQKLLACATISSSRLGSCQAEELGLLLFQPGLLLDDADLVVRELLQAGGALFVGAAPGSRRCRGSRG